MWVDRLFVYSADRSNFMFQLVHTYRPGTMDTSLVSTDNINNPRTMNAIYNLGARHGAGAALGPGDDHRAGARQQAVQRFRRRRAADAVLQAAGTVFTPHVLKDGSDSVGALGALNRVYLNIGLFSEEWLRHFNPVVGGKPITPIRIADGAEELGLLAGDRAGHAGHGAVLPEGRPAGPPRRCAGRRGLPDADAATLDRGKTVFAETCARCHSSKLPTPPAEADLQGCAGPDYLACWNRYWAWTKTDDVQGADARHRRGARFPRRQLPLHRCARAGDAAADQCLQPARDQRARRQHLGQFLLGSLQDAAFGRHDHRA